MGKHQPTPATAEVVPYGSDFILPITNEPVAQAADGILERIDARNRMHTAALAGIDSTSGSLVVREIRKDIDERQARSKSVADRALADCERQIADIDIDPLDPELSGAETLGRVSQTLNQHNSTLVASVAMAAEAKRQWRKFRLDRGIERDALHPSPANTGLVLVLSAAAEVLVGTFVYDGAADSSAVALFYAGGASGLVMGAGLAAGWALRYAAHPSEGRHRLSRLIGSLSLVAAALGVSTVALTIGRYRDQLAAYAVDATVVPKLDPSIILRPWDWLQLGTLDGMLMTGMTLALGGVAAIKGWRGFCDPIPGYSRIDRKWRLAAGDALERQQELRAAFNAVIDNASAEVDEELARQKALCAAAEAHAREGFATARGHRVTGERLVDIGNASVRGAQEAFQEIRPELPAYFADSYYTASDIPPLEIDPDTLQAAASARRGIYDRNRTAAPGIKRSLVQVRARLSAIVEEAIARATGLDPEEAERQARSKLSGGDQ